MRTLAPLVLAALPQTLMVTWVAVDLANPNLGTPLGFVLFAASFGAIWAARPSVNRYLSSVQNSGREVRTPEGLVQFTPDFVRYYSERARLPAIPVLLLVYLPLVALGLAWGLLVLFSAYDLVGV